MADGVEVNLTGLDSVLGKLDAVSQVTRDKSGRAALRKAANVIRDRARTNAARLMILSPRRLSTKTLWSASAARRFAEPAIQRFVSG